MPIPNALRPTLQSLLDASRQNRVLWHEGANDGQFTVSTDTFSVTIGRRPGRGWDGANLALSLLNIHGNIVSEASAVEGNTGGADGLLLSQLYTEAGRIALSVDSTLADLNRALAGAGPIGRPRSRE